MQSWDVEPARREPPARYEDREGASPPEGAFAFHGLPWSIIDDIIHGPSRLMPVALKACAHIRHERNLTALVEDVARKLKTTTINVLEAASQCPTALKVSPDGRRLTLSCAPDPFNMSPREAKEEERRQATEAKRRAATAARAAKDEEDTPFNALRRRVETLGLSRDDAHNFVGFLLRTYGMKQTEGAIAVAEANKPGEARPYILSVIKRQLHAKPTESRATRIREHQAPQPGSKTLLVGWEDCERNGVRHRLYRLPSGSIRREAPAAHEVPPSIEEDPGYKVT